MEKLDWYRDLIAKLLGFDETNFALLEKEDEAKVKDNQELMLEIIGVDPPLFKLASSIRLQNDKGFVIKALTQDNIPYSDIPDASSKRSRYSFNICY